mmetsp:Transcript_24203/g.34147  ORF Transcript_24203/g.34147 Transcript_24203/m.34147 type:complete len:220 (+) Transcript_24203:875-1534(+)
MATRLEREANNAILHFEDLDGDVLLSHAENFEVVDDGFFGLSASNFDAEVVASGLPMQINVAHVVELPFPDHGSAGDLQEDHRCRNIIFLRNPVGDNVLRRRPAHRLDTGNLDGLFSNQTHGGCFVDGNLVLTYAGKVFVVVAPLKFGPTLQTFCLERSEHLTGSNIMDVNLVAGKCDHVLFIWRELDVSDVRMPESHELLEIVITPQNDALFVESRQV